MKTYQFINDRNRLLEEGRLIIRSTEDRRFIDRVFCVSLMLNGMKAKDLAAYSGHSERVLQLWLRKADQDGWDSLHKDERSGRKARLTREDIEKLREVMLDDPRTYGFQVWDGPSAAEYIRRTFQIDYGIRATQKLLRRMGLPLHRPTVRPSPSCDADEESHSAP